MKKILASILAIVTLVTLTACGQAKEKIDLEKTKTDIYTNVMCGTKYLKDYDISKKNILEVDGMYEFSFAVNKKKKLGYFIGKPAEGKEEALEKELKKFFKKYDYKTETKEGYIIYIASTDNDSVMKLIEDNKYAQLLAGLTYADVEMVLGEDSKDLVEEGLYALPSLIISPL